MPPLAPSAYQQLVERINKFPQGAPASELLYKILAILFSEKEAALIARLPLRPFSAEKAAGIWGVSEAEARRTLDALASRAVLIDLEHGERTMYFLPPPMAGFFEFSLMRVRPDIDQKELARLFFQYINVEEDFARELFEKGDTRIGRVFVNEQALPEELTTQVLDYERASEVIRSASHIAVGLCYCRNKMAHVGRACDAPLDNCMTLNQVARALIKNGSARQVEAEEGLELLQQARESNLVQCGDNVQKKVSFICNCCGCCCEAMLALRRLSIPGRQYSTNFIARLDRNACTGCGRCESVCAIKAIALQETCPPTPPSAQERDQHPTVPPLPETLPPLQGEGWGGDGVFAVERQPTRPKAILQEEVCLGCGVCVRNCKAGALRLEARPHRVVTPVNAAHRVVLMAIERGKLQHLLFDNQAYLSHRVMATFLGAFLDLPPVHRVMANQQLKSRFLERIMRDVDITDFSE